MLDALAQQPVAVGVNIHALQFYDSGVVTIDDCPPADADPLRAINHAAVLTGWGHDEATDQYYWILRNTYGENWGEDGHARPRVRPRRDGFGTCALYTEGNYPLVGSLRCTPGAVRKEAVAHGSRVWLYPGGYNMGPRDRAGPRGGVAGVLEEVWSGVAGAIPGLDAILASASDDDAKWALGAAGALAAASAAIMAVQARRLAGMRAGGGAGERVRLLATEEGVRGGGERR